MKKFFDEFKKFIARGNVMDLAVGLIMGSAFTSIVTALGRNFSHFFEQLFRLFDIAVFPRRYASVIKSLVFRSRTLFIAFIDLFYHFFHIFIKFIQVYIL